MLTTEKRIKALIDLGQLLLEYSTINEAASTQFDLLVKTQHTYNSWLIEPFVLKAAKQWGMRLSSNSLHELISRYPALKKNRTVMNVVVISEENIPFAGMQDLIMVLLAGHHFFAKNADHRNNLLQFITDLLISIESEFSEYIHWNNVPKEADAYLVHARPENEATFASYFGTRNSLIRGKRISVGIVSPDDNAAVFKQFGEDIFTFWGLSPFCVRKIFIPAKFPFNLFFESIDEFAYLYQHNRYANNYDYHKSVFMMDRIPFYDNGFLILRESSELHVPPGCLYYEFYDTIDDVISKTKTSASEIQQVITNLSEFSMAVKPGDAHNYKLWEYADHKDTLGFLL